MKEIIVISGSPRKNGDTSKITHLFEERMKHHGNINFNYIYLKNKNLNFCRGCLLCMKKGENSCPIKDDAIDLRNELLEADGVIFVTPVYIHSTSALMKNFLDRFAYFMHRPAFHNKPALLITSTEISGTKETIHYMKFPIKAWGFSYLGDISIIVDAFKLEGKFRNSILNSIDIKAKKFVKKLDSSQIEKPSLSSLQFFNMLKTKVILHRKNLPYDYEYWKIKGWLDSCYFYPASINPIKKLFGKTKIQFIKFVMRIKLGKELYRKIFTEPMLDQV